jgi:hypothetical protein
MNEQVLVIATALFALVGAPFVQMVKWVYEQATGKPLEGKPALYASLIVAFLFGVASVGLSSAFNPPYPDTWQGWAALIGGAIGAIFAVMTVIYKLVLAPQAK